MKKILLIVMTCLMITGLNVQAQEVPQFNNFPVYGETDLESEWELSRDHKFTMNYNLFGQSFADGAWQGGLGYATGMWLSGNDTRWGLVGSVLAVNIPILLDSDYDKKEIWIGKNAGALSVGLSATFTIEMYRNGKSSWNLKHWLVKRY